MANEMTKYSELFAYNMDRLRRKSGLLKYEFCERIDLTGTMYDSYQKGKISPKLVSIERIANALDISPIEFFREKDGTLGTDDEPARLIGTDENPLALSHSLMQSLLGSKTKKFAVQVETDNMAPFAQKSSILSCTFVQEPVANKIHLISVDNVMLPYRFERSNLGYWCVPQCRGFKPFKTKPDLTGFILFGVINSIKRDID